MYPIPLVVLILLLFAACAAGLIWLVIADRLEERRLAARRNPSSGLEQAGLNSGFRAGLEIATRPMRNWRRSRQHALAQIARPAGLRRFFGNGL